MNYILITPVKNEEFYIHDLIENILSQTKLPVLWVIIDGGSNDLTVSTIKKYSLQYSWILLKEQTQFSNNRGHLNFALGVREAYEFLQSYCYMKNISYEFIGKIDADNLLSPDFFEFLIKQFQSDPKLGVACGKSYTINNNCRSIADCINSNQLTEDNYPEDELPDKRLYRRSSLEEIGGFPVSKYSPDTVTLAKIRIRNWKIKTFDGTKVINIRADTGIEKNSWKSSRQLGEARYYLDYHPMLFLLSIIYLTFKKRQYNPIAVTIGYFSGVIAKKPKIEDNEIREYFRKKRIHEIVNLNFRRKFLSNILIFI